MPLVAGRNSANETKRPRVNVPVAHNVTLDSRYSKCSRSTTPAARLEGSRNPTRRGSFRYSVRTNEGSPDPILIVRLSIDASCF